MILRRLGAENFRLCEDAGRGLLGRIALPAFGEGDEDLVAGQEP